MSKQLAMPSGRASLIGLTNGRFRTHQIDQIALGRQHQASNLGWEVAQTFKCSIEPLDFGYVV